jgi:hypothetical protein
LEARRRRGPVGVSEEVGPLMLSLGEFQSIIAVSLRVAGLATLTFGCLITLINIYLSFVRYPLIWLQGYDSKEVRHISGIPRLGSLLLWFGAILLWSWQPVVVGSLYQGLTSSRR